MMADPLGIWPSGLLAVVVAAVDEVVMDGNFLS
jgi:hypothetical protein